MTFEKLISFLIERKNVLSESSKLAQGSAKISLEAQIRVIETLLIFIHKKGEVNVMEKMKLSLDEQATPLDTLRRPRKSSEAVIEAVLDLIKGLKPGYGKKINAPNVKPKSMAAKLYRLKKQGVLPPEVTIITSGTDVLIGKR